MGKEALLSALQLSSTLCRPCSSFFQLLQLVLDFSFIGNKQCAQQYSVKGKHTVHHEHVIVLGYICIQVHLSKCTINTHFNTVYSITLSIVDNNFLFLFIF